MLSSSTSSEETSNTTTASRPNQLSSSSSSSSRRTRPSPRRSMEEVWKDINLSSLPETPTFHHPMIRAHHHHRPNTQHTATFRPNPGLFQDFLARPFSPNDPRQPAATSRASRLLNAPSSGRPITALSLKSGPEFNFVENTFSFASPFEGLPCASGKKRCPSLEEDSGVTNNGDRRHKRMIKNRESAARSRARKQAYTSELELVIEGLKKECAKLKKEQHKLSEAATAQLPKKHSLQRSSTAPF